MNLSVYSLADLIYLYDCLSENTWAIGVPDILENMSDYLTKCFNCYFLKSYKLVKILYFDCVYNFILSHCAMNMYILSFSKEIFYKYNISDELHLYLFIFNDVK